MFATFSDGTILTGTDIHPVWSLDREDWIPLGELTFGEQVHSNNGPLWLIDSEIITRSQNVYNIEVDGQHVYQVGDSGVLVHNTCSSADFARLRPGSQLGNDIKNNKIFRLTDHEANFVNALSSRKPNLQIYRTNQKGGLGDFLILDRSNARRPIGFLLDLKRGGGSAGNQFANAAEAIRIFGLSKETLIVRSGNFDELIELLRRGRSAF